MPRDEPFLARHESSTPTWFLGTAENSTGVRSELAVTVKQAERRYPDDPAATWALDGLRVQVATFSDKPGRVRSARRLP